MVYLVYLVFFVVLALIPLQISAHIGPGLSSIMLHLVCVVLVMVIYKARPQFLGSYPEYVPLIVIIPNIIAIAGNVIMLSTGTN